MRKPVRASCLGLACALAWPALSFAEPSAVPDFTGYWQKGGAYVSTFEPPPNGGPGPVVDPKPHDENGIPWVGDYTNPILKPHAAAAVKATGDRILSGQEDLPAYSLCWPSGVPQVLNLREPVQFLQTRNLITILYQRDHQVRRVYLDVPHSKELAPTWYGESVGHYEGGDTLVIDTIGLSPRTDTDKFGTPHSDKLHVIERYKLLPDGKTLVVDFTVEDPETFTTAWSARATYKRGKGPVEEIVCAENNKNASTGEDYPIPMAHRADF
jgi:hypothetical protein